LHYVTTTVVAATIVIPVVWRGEKFFWWFKKPAYSNHVYTTENVENAKINIPKIKCTTITYT